ncbi:Thioesterase superfamily protein [Planctomycetes bacterium Pla163]|uniref:Thioesterase superfamily protein n=1 Tax=Rohdeia mirabilis TaxID=2528008 RepID=A0A518CW59_9BACT|nr:Thioesterase superfamily protein [Planctomycetes bacterium Pla163]
MRFRTRLRTRWVDEDNQGVLNNAVQLTLLEEARLAYFGELGLMDGAHFPFVLAQCNLRFVSPGRGATEVDVALTTVHVGTSSLRQVARVSDTAGVTWLEADVLLVGWDNATRAKRPFDEHFRTAVLAFEAGSDRAD